MRPNHVHKKIKSIQFGLISPKMVKKVATAKVVTPELYDREGYPVEGGLMDTRLGVIDPGLVCKTDGFQRFHVNLSTLEIVALMILIL